MLKAGSKLNSVHHMLNRHGKPLRVFERKFMDLLEELVDTSFDSCNRKEQLQSLEKTWETKYACPGFDRGLAEKRLESLCGEHAEALAAARAMEVIRGTERAAELWGKELLLGLDVENTKKALFVHDTKVSFEEDIKELCSKERELVATIEEHLRKARPFQLRRTLPECLEDAMTVSPLVCVDSSFVESKSEELKAMIRRHVKDVRAQRRK